MLLSYKELVTPLSKRKKEEGLQSGVPFLPPTLY